MKNRKTIISVSGGKTSSYLAANYESDYLINSIVRTNDLNCKFPDELTRKVISDRLGLDFIGTLEDNNLIYTILDLEQYLGKEIKLVTGVAFEDLIRKRKMLPSLFRRFCTSDLKVIPIAKYIHSLNLEEVPFMYIGFRANEGRRVKNYDKRTNEEGIVEIAKLPIGKKQNGHNIYLKDFKYCYPKFPLYEEGILRYDILKFWENKPIRFQPQNNCIGCFHKKPHELKKMSVNYPEKFNWFIDMEKELNFTFKTNITYQKISKLNLLQNLFSDSEGCDSGFCGF